jgi:hypothetical protein
MTGTGKRNSKDAGKLRREVAQMLTELKIRNSKS